MIDQRVSEGIKVNFFKHKALTTTIPAQLVKKYKMPIVPVFIERFENIKFKILSQSVFAVSKSGTVSLQISSSNIPSIIIYKLNFINFMIFKMLVNVKFANIINIINHR